MPSYVIPDKCDGCKALDKTACQYICPNDLMVLNKDLMKAYNQEPEMCWECYSCVKICPNQAIEVRGYADFMPLGAVVQPLRSTDQGRQEDYRKGGMHLFSPLIRWAAVTWPRRRWCRR